jgi:hypothetical protein
MWSNICLNAAARRCSCTQMEWVYFFLVAWLCKRRVGWFKRCGQSTCEMCRCVCVCTYTSSWVLLRIDVYVCSICSRCNMVWLCLCSQSLIIVFITLQNQSVPSQMTIVSAYYMELFLNWHPWVNHMRQHIDKIQFMHALWLSARACEIFLMVYWLQCVHTHVCVCLCSSVCPACT